MSKPEETESSSITANAGQIYGTNYYLNDVYRAEGEGGLLIIIDNLSECCS